MVRLGPGKYFGQVVGTGSFGPLTITATRYRPGDVLPPHSHEQPYLFVMIAGALRECASGRDYDCTRGWLVFNRAGEPHRDLVHESGAEGLNIGLPADWLPASCRGPESCEPFVYRFAGPALTAVGALQFAMQARDCLRTLGVEEAVTGLLDSLCRPSVSRGRAPRWLDRAEMAVRAHYRDGLSLGTVAGAAGVHPAHLCREFRRAFGCTLTQYAARLRGDDAVARLFGTTDSLATVAAKTGFADQAHLTRTIRRLFGTTPARLRGDRN